MTSQVAGDKEVNRLLSPPRSSCLPPTLTAPRTRQGDVPPTGGVALAAARGWLKAGLFEAETGLAVMTAADGCMLSVSLDVR